MKESIAKRKIGSAMSLGLVFLMVFTVMLPFVTTEASAFSGKKGSKYTVWDGGQITYGSGSGGYSNSRKCDLGDDLGTRYSYCVQPDKPSPGTGTVTVDKVITDDNDTGKWNAMRNIIYYSPSYPGYEDNVKNIKDNYYTGNFSKDWGIAHMALSYVYAGRPSDMATYGGTHASDLGDVWTKAKKLGDALWKPDSAKDDAVPDSFKVFICYMSGVQDMVVGYLEAPGYLNMKKVSNRKSITDDNDCYSLEGAKYTVCDSDGKEVGVLTMKANGESNTLELLEGKYTVKETKAPPGYAKDTETYTVKIESEETTTFTAKEEPITDLVSLLLTKKPVGYPHNHGEGDAILKGAVYMFCYYDRYTLNQEAVLKAALGSSDVPSDATAVWYFVTDAKGKIDGSDPKLADGYTSSALYKDKDGKIAFPLGIYAIQEIAAPTGYLVNDEVLTVTIKEDGTDNLHVSTYNESIKGDDTIFRGGVKLAKIDNDLDEAYAQGDATLEGAEFTVYNKSKESVMVGGKEYAVDAACLVIKTDKNGIAASGDHDLPYGTYLVKETKPSTGYLLNEKWSRSFEIREDGQVIDLTEDKVREAVERGGVQIIKRDKELAKPEALGGADLEGIVMTIKNVSGRDVVVRKDLDNKTDTVDWKKLESKKDLFDAETIKRVPTGQDVGKITVHWNEEKKAYTAETLPDDLPYGTYTIRESKTNDSYQRTDKTEHLFKVRKDGTIYTYDDGENEVALTFDDYVYRSDLQGTKIGDGNSERFSYVPFKITSVSNDETHVLVADMNGYFSTKDNRTKDKLEEDEDADIARKQNPFDDLLTAESISTADIKERKEDIKQGVWFGTGEFNSNAAMNGSYGALPYDSYIIEELPCEKNEGYTLQKFYFTVDEKSQNGFVDLETITDDIPEIGTEASVDGKNANVSPQKEITLVDTIEYTGLKKGETYTAKGMLIDKATGEVIKDAAGKDITAEQEFVARTSHGKVKVTFTFDGSNMYGKDTVVYEAVYASDGHITAKHEDIEDEGQTVIWEKPDPKYEMYKIRTTKAPSKGDKFGFFARDEVEYEVHVENTGNITLTMDVSDQFTQNAEYFTEPQLKDVKFSGDGTWNNKADYVKDENAAEQIADDAQPTSEEQTGDAAATETDTESTAVTDTEAATDENTNTEETKAENQDVVSSDSDSSSDNDASGGDTDQTGDADADENGLATETETTADDSTDDVTAGGNTSDGETADAGSADTGDVQEAPKQIANITLHPGETAVVTYTAVIKDEAKEYLAAAAADSDSLDDQGKDTNQKYQKNETDDEDGYWNTAYCENVTYPNPENPDESGTLEPKEDVAQTPVQTPEIGTTLEDDEGNKAVVASDKTILIDTIAYKALDPTKWYQFTGILMVKDTKEPLVENGSPIEVTSEPFKPEEPDGTAAVTFVIDTTNLAGKELVAFETAYRLNDYEEGADVTKIEKTIVAEHKDLGDEGQTVKITEKPKDTPKETPKKSTPKESTPGTSGDTPKTGDDRNPWIWIGLMGAGLAMLSGSLVLLRKRDDY